MTVAAFASLSALALFVGALMGMLGGGGGFLYVLMLLMVTDVSAAAAVGTGVCAAAVGATVSLVGHHRGATIDWRRAVGFLPAGALGAMAAGILAAAVPERVLVVSIVIGYAVVGALPLRLTRLARRSTSNDSAGGNRAVRVPSAGRMRWGRAGIGTIAGVAAGAFAVNGGPLISAYLTGYERLDPRRAVGTAVATLTPLSIVAALTHLAGNTIDYRLLAVIAPAAGLGGYLGARLTARLAGRVLAPVLGLLTLLTMIPLLLR